MRKSDEFKGKNVSQSMGFRGCGRRSLARIRRAATALSWRRASGVAVGIARLGGISGFIGRVGDDPFGALMQRTLLTEGVDITYLKQDEWHRTSTVLVDLNDQGERSFTFMVRPSADLFLETTDLPCWRHGEWLHLCSIALSAEPSRTSAFTAMTAIRHAGGFVSFDPNIREDLWQDEHLLRLCLRQALQLADVVKLSEEEWRLISGKTQNDRDICALAKEYEIAMLLVTKGAEGVVVCYRGQVHHFAGMSVNCVDSTGAGDAFVAGLLTGLSSTGLSTDEREMRRIIDLAQRCGALAVTAKGAMTALPCRQELE